MKARRKSKNEPLFADHITPKVKQTVYIHKSNNLVICCDIRLSKKVLLTTDK